MTDPLSAMYSTWFNALPGALRGIGIPPANEAAAGTIEGLFAQTLKACWSMMTNGKLGVEPLKALVEEVTGESKAWLEAAAKPRAAMPGIEGLTQALQPWASMWLSLVPGAATGAHGNEALELAFERAFGGLGDAFGLGPMRAFERAWREMSGASTSMQQAKAECFALVLQAWTVGSGQLINDLQGMHSRGERVESMLDFLRLWAKAIDPAVHDAMQGEKGLQITAKMIRASSEYNEHLQKTIALTSDALQLPTRGDLDTAFREIQDLKRELRRLKKALPAAAQKKLMPAQEVS